MGKHKEDIQGYTQEGDGKVCLLSLTQNTGRGGVEDRAYHRRVLPEQLAGKKVVFACTRTPLALGPSLMQVAMAIYGGWC